jgi:aminoglycoside phosphotransferase (APT) family kinase protein
VRAPEIETATPGWLTGLLRDGGFLTTGEVAAVEAGPATATMLSSFVPLAVTYAAGSAGRLPRRLLMKLNRGSFFAAGQREIRFYQVAAAAGGPLPLPTCFGTAESVERATSCILLEDLSASHGPPATAWPAPPPRQEREAAIAALARLHARWWADGGAGEPPATWGPLWAERARAELAGFADAAGARLTRDDRARYERVIAMASTIDQRVGDRPGTVLHGDAHAWNFLYPRNPEDGGCVVIDWQLWKQGPGAFDLAYMIALHGQPAYRAEHEAPLLRFYAGELRRHGVDYPWRDLWSDYRLAVAFNLLYPVLLHAKDVPEVVWGPHLERGLAAFDDLGCAELI